MVTEVRRHRNTVGKFLLFSEWTTGDWIFINACSARNVIYDERCYHQDICSQQWHWHPTHSWQTTGPPAEVPIASPHHFSVRKANFYVTYNTFITYVHARWIYRKLGKLVLSKHSKIQEIGQGWKLVLVDTFVYYWNNVVVRIWDSLFLKYRFIVNNYTYTNKDRTHIGTR